MCSDPANGGFVFPSVTNCCVHECPGCTPSLAQMSVRPRVLRRRRGEGDETYYPPPKPIPARELVYSPSPDSVSVSGASAPTINPTVFASRLAKRKAARKAAREAAREASAS